MIHTPTVVTVSQINTYIKSLLDDNALLRNVYISGEISNFTNHYRSGHYYMTLKDDKAAIKAVMFHSQNERLRFLPQNGMKVLARGRVSVYDRDGVYQLYIEDMQPDGLGALNLALEQRKEKLRQEGLFDEERKRPLPRIPLRVGVVTSPTGAAVRDIMQVLSRRFPLAQVVFCPVQVQGEQAAPQIANAIQRFSVLKPADVLIIGRGGGSLEDLWAFNEEIVARAVADCTIPVISAVGHETDFTICDLVADMRAPTPSAAAELAVPDQYAQRVYLFSLLDSIRKKLLSKTALETARLDSLQNAAVLRGPQALLEQRQQRLDAASLRLLQRTKSIVQERSTRFSALCGEMHALSPFQVLSRGYAIAFDEAHQTIKSVKNISQEDALQLRLSDGILHCRVNSIESWENHEKTEL